MRRFFPAWVILVAASLLIGGCSGKGAQGGPPGGAMPPTQVETIKVAAHPLVNQFETVGTLRAQESAVIRPEIDGKVVAINFADGQSVGAGTSLFVLDPSLAQADLNEANTNLVNSRRAAARARELASKQLIARADLDKASAEFGVDQARATSARTRLDKTRIRAPFAGVVGLRQISVGDYVKAGDALVDLVRMDPIEVDLKAPEVVLSTLATGQKINLLVDAFPSRTFTGEIVAIAPTVDLGGRSVLLRARLANSDGVLRPGMSARVQIELGMNPNALLIPEQAIWPNGDQKMVYVVRDGKAKLLPVTLGARQPGTVEVVSGLNAGDEVIVSGQLKLFDGAPVAPVAAQLPAAPATAAN
jgi:membrane fusion protein (multidrug efflux system)